VAKVEDFRLEQLKQWASTLTSLQACDLSRLVPASSDASFRRYFRLACREVSYIFMDAPPDKEDCVPFVQVAMQLQQLGVRVPAIFAKDLAQGFLLLEDLGRETLFDRLKQATETEVEAWYRSALDILVQLQQQAALPKYQGLVQSLPDYSEALLRQEMALFTDWLLQKHLQIVLSPLEKQAWQSLVTMLVEVAGHQPRTYVLRDYHSRNLMVLSASAQAAKLGVLDFQDAVQGPLTYDAISLLRDCYQRWPYEQVMEWQRYYFLSLQAGSGAGDFAKLDWADFQKWMDFMGMQRHLKAAGIFARLFHRDGKAGYLADIPNTLQYVYEVGQGYRETLALVRLLESRILPAMEAVS